MGKALGDRFGKKKQLSIFRQLQKKARQIPEKSRDASKLRRILAEYERLNGGDLGLADRLQHIDETGNHDSDDEAHEDADIMHMYDDMVRHDDMPKSMNMLEKVSEKKNKDIFLQYGTGIVNYFQLYERLIKLFCLLSVLAIP